MSKNLSELSGRKGLDNSLFDVLGKAAEEKGAPSVEALKNIADDFLIGSANTFGASSAYDFLRPSNEGKEIYVCNGSSCRTAGTQESLRGKIEERFSEDSIGEMCCLGRCYENSAFHYQGKNYSGTDIDELEKISEKDKTSSSKYHIESYGKALLTETNFNSNEAFKAALMQLLEFNSSEVIQEVHHSGLRGRGGAGFPMSIKLEACAKEIGSPKFIVCNADEGDPGAFSDRYLLEEQPFAVLFGMLVSGYAVGADRGVVYIRGEYPESIEIIQKTIDGLNEEGLLGENIMGSGFDFGFKVVAGQGAYICGEETAMLNSIEGQRPEVRVRPPYPAQSGLFNRPTVVNNVETLAFVPFIFNGAGLDFSSIGTEKSSGTKLVSLDGYFNRPGLYEVEMGTPLSVVVNELGKGFRSPVKAMHIGGPLGGLVPIEMIDKLNLSFESFKEHGFLLGHASVLCIPEDYPLVDYLQHLFEFTAHESCGKCFPCRLGSVRGGELLAKAQFEGYKIDRTLFDDLVETLAKGSLCALGGGLPLPVRNALKYFEEELKVYFN
jgi:NADH-quinone oxidoreductase subunit F